MNPSPQPPFRQPLGPVEWAAIITTALTMVVTFATVTYKFGEFGTRLESIDRTTQGLPVIVEGIKKDVESFKKVEAKVDAIDERLRVKGI